jgi:hypothetical protein
VDPYLKYGLLVPLTLLWGVIYVYGGTREWKWLIDPPVYLAFFFPQVLVRDLFGKEMTKIYTIGIGWIILAIALWEVLVL